jgi:hypothetical protein
LTARDAELKDGRFVGGVFKPKSPEDKPDAARTVRAYVGRVSGQTLYHPPEKDAPTDKPRSEPLEFWVVLLDAGHDERLIGFQVRQTDAVQWGVPWHMLLRVKRDGDTLTVQGPKHLVVWMPSTQPLDPPAPNERPVPPLDDLEKRADGGMFVTFDPDRLLQVYSHYVADPAFWDEATTFRRVVAPEKKQ